ncbi:unnamed protein product [Cylicocyclus nassatus]|uniref:Uncharacterized protein n=1 Tax=Cylicocyclus nassatus TaxID=53992 RepID=A0AA36MCP5_CYLNA|nr:unnamed protein product [Cylicocyclus nassatus]
MAQPPGDRGGAGADDGDAPTIEGNLDLTCRPRIFFGFAPILFLSTKEVPRTKYAVHVQHVNTPSGAKVIEAIFCGSE